VYVQNASLEIAWTRVVLEDRTIGGNVLMPFITQEFEGFDVNNTYDWHLAENMVTKGEAQLPAISKSPFAIKLRCKEYKYGPKRRQTPSKSD
jgi:hypothetical protein